MNNDNRIYIICEVVHVGVLRILEATDSKDFVDEFKRKWVGENKLMVVVKLLAR